MKVIVGTWFQPGKKPEDIVFAEARTMKSAEKKLAEIEREIKPVEMVPFNEATVFPCKLGFELSIWDKKDVPLYLSR